MLLFLHLAAHAEIVRIPSSPFTIDLDQRHWFPVHPFAGDAALELQARPSGLPRAVIWWTKSMEPDLGASDLSAYNAWLARSAVTGIERARPGPTTRESSANWGPALLTPIQIPGTAQTYPVECRHALVTASGGMLSVAVMDIRGSGAIGRKLHELLEAVRRPPSTATPAPTGHVEVDAGYDLDLPAGWRGLTAVEAVEMGISTIGRGQHGGSLSFFHAIDPARSLWLEQQDEVLTCMALPVLGEPVDIVDPARSDYGAAAFFRRVDSMLGGGTVARNFGGFRMATQVRVGEDATPVWLDAQSPTEAKVAQFGDREGYVWTGRGQVDGHPGDFTAVLLSYDDIDLTCVAGGRKETSEALRATLLGLRVHDAAQHPRKASLREQYFRIWPWTQPWAQLWVVGAVTVGLATLAFGISILRAMRTPRLGE